MRRRHEQQVESVVYRYGFWRTLGAVIVAALSMMACAEPPAGPVCLDTTYYVPWQQPHYDDRTLVVAFINPCDRTLISPADTGWAEVPKP